MNASQISEAPSPAGVRPHAWLASALRVAGLLLAISPFLPPIFRLTGHDALAKALDDPWVNSCHRMPERTLTIGGELMPICSRCLGLVEGVGLGLALAWPFRDLRTLRITLSFAAAFLFLELTTQDLGWHAVFHPSRLLSGFLCSFPIGAAAGALAKKVASFEAPPAGAPSA